MSLANGTKLGPYEILAPIGAGGMGEVYKARDTRLDRTVAVKILPGHMADQPEVRQRFEREAKAVSSLNHPHICTLFDVGRQDDVDFLVMEYLEGETLQARLTKGPLPMDHVLRYAVQIAEALAQAHRQGVSHRDLKPGNIILTKTGAKLLDFGLAKLRGPRTDPAAGLSTLPTVANELTQKGTILGTFQYMAPEGSGEEMRRQKILKAELRRLLTEAALAPQQAFPQRATALRERLRRKYGELSDSARQIREDREARG